jgi:hypothetical protein
MAALALVRGLRSTSAAGGGSSDLSSLRLAKVAVVNVINL